MIPYDPVQVELFGNLLAGVAEEMGVALQHSAFSANIKERRDFSCALFDRSGRMVAQGENIPVHLGSMPASVASVLEECAPRAGEMVLVNDPFHGGTHLPDLTLVAPWVNSAGDPPAFYVANRAHHSDVGGASPGSMPLAREIYEEGLVIPPVRLVREDRPSPDVMRLLLANVRTPEERRGDLEAQVAACRLGIRRLGDLSDRYGAEFLEARAADAIAYAERMMRATVRAIPDGEYRFEDRLDDDGAGGPAVTLRLKLEIRGDEAFLDFSGSDPQVPGGLNAVASITRSAVYYAFRCLAADRIPSNHGCFEPIHVTLPSGSVLDALPPAAVAGGNVETSQRVVDLVLGALAGALPERIPAASQGTMNNVAFGGTALDGRPFAYYETLGGGCGGGPTESGASGLHSHMTNSRNTPIEAMEHQFPVLVREYGLRRDSGGKGVRPGGDGVVREFEFLASAELTLLTERRRLRPWGLRGGHDGQPGVNRLRRRGAAWMDLEGKCRISVNPGDRLRIETPGGGGWGPLSSVKERE